MNFKKIFFFTLFIYLLVNLNIVSQTTNLRLLSIKKNEQQFLNSVSLRSTYNKSEVASTIALIQKKIKEKGYFFANLDSIVKRKKEILLHYSLGKKFDSIYIDTNYLKNDLIIETDKHQPIIKLGIDETQSFLKKQSKLLEDKGYSFSEIKLNDFKTIENTLYCTLTIQKKIKRKIDKVIYRNYTKFPVSFTNNYFNINKRTIFNQKKITQISNLTKTLKFIEEIKSPEILFKKDSTLLYLYFKKKQNNSFDGLVNFASNDTGKLNFNGHLDLKLNNVFNNGEKFELFWNSLVNQSQEIKLATTQPYIFNSKITPEIQLSIFRQDSLFTNTKFEIKTNYQIKPNSNLRLIYSTTNSSESNNNLDELKSFQNSFFGIGYEFTKFDNAYINDEKIHINLEINFGKRKTDISTNQIKIESTVSYNYKINARNSIYLKNISGILNSSNYIQNELFRLGGVNSIRGFLDQSLFANTYSIQNIEYRLLTSRNSYIFSVTDIGFLKNNQLEEKLIGLGLGFAFTVNNSKIEINSVIGNSLNRKFDFKQTQLLISWTSFF
ncbi:ShlB/FhaC/HecB family hemolysin secretion/activation protein [uncultured Polaribacter sp.]|uniref:ShlB/FhaC/HecB family hemolysin secretion/activation protein n=1 Tax=uncultured Polaribacter sp. TaxID=174711 RepID=UPI0026363948|nr:ShlB/FhaC/HecB family hemolysin secretion/activation protein [uncultured Polaribacter sp.]